MHTSDYALRTWMALAAALIPVLLAAADPDPTLPRGRQEAGWHGPASNRVDSIQARTNRTAIVARGGPGRIGLVIGAAPDGATVERVVIGGPAWQAGVRNGDVIVTADTWLLAGLALPQVAQILRGQVGSEVELTLKRAGQRELLKVKAKRGLIPPPTDVKGLSAMGPTLPPDPTAAALSVYDGAARAAAAWFGGCADSGGCGSAVRWAYQLIL